MGVFVINCEVHTNPVNCTSLMVLGIVWIDHTFLLCNLEKIICLTARLFMQQ